MRIRDTEEGGGYIDLPPLFVPPLKLEFVFMKVGRAIADLGYNENVYIEHTSEAVQYRNLDRDLWK
ncbi:MAG: hypothetical protein ACYSR1_07545 [Planctomycetota bacterium]|jgi:hypothetical protein